MTLKEKARDMRDAIDMLEGAMIGLPNFVDMPDVFDGVREDVEIVVRMKVGQMRRICKALQECTRIINSPEYILK